MCSFTFFSQPPRLWVRRLRQLIKHLKNENMKIFKIFKIFKIYIFKREILQSISCTTPHKIDDWVSKYIFRNFTFLFKFPTGVTSSFLKGELWQSINWREELKNTLVGGWYELHTRNEWRRFVTSHSKRVEKIDHSASSIQSCFPSRSLCLPPTVQGRWYPEIYTRFECSFWPFATEVRTFSELITGGALTLRILEEAEELNYTPNEWRRFKNTLETSG
jgi:hypothetical protein